MDRLEFDPSISGWSHLWAWSMPGKDKQALCQVRQGRAGNMSQESGSL